MSGRHKDRKAVDSKDAYGAHLAKSFGVEQQQTHTHVQSLQRGITAVTHLVMDKGVPELTESLGRNDSFLLALHLKPMTDFELFIDGRYVKRAAINAGQTHVYDMSSDPQARILQPAEALHFLLPRISLDEFAEQHEIARISDLNQPPGVGLDDRVMAQVSNVVLSAFQYPHATTGLLFDQILNAVCAHTLSTYAGAGPVAVRTASGLAPWQERRAKALMDEVLDAPLAQIAASCRLSVTHFVRAFRQSTGMSPHQWLIKRRLEKAKSLLRDPRLEIAEIALASGFSSQSHLTRAFAAHLGVSPGRWRRLL